MPILFNRGEGNSYLQVIMKKLGRILAAVIAEWIVGLTLILASLYFSNGGVDFTTTDITGFGVMFLVASSLLMLLYVPVLTLVQRRSATRSHFLSPIISGLVLNIPLILLLVFLSGRKMSAPEALTMMLTYVAAGAAFGFAFDWKSKSALDS
jgi:hypothetical protein